MADRGGGNQLKLRYLDVFILVFAMAYLAPIPLIYLLSPETFADLAFNKLGLAIFTFLGMLVAVRVVLSWRSASPGPKAVPAREPRLSWASVARALPMVLVFLLAVVVTNGMTGAIGSREGLDFQNFNATSSDTLRTQVPTLIMLGGAFCWGRYLVGRNLPWAWLGAAFSGVMLGFSATRWQMLLSMSPVLCWFLVRFSIGKIFLAIAAAFLLSIPFAFLRSGYGSAQGGAYYGWILKDVPLVESAYAVEVIGEHPHGRESFISGFIAYPLPRFLFNKGVDEAAADFNGSRAGLNIAAESGNVLPGVIGSLYMYGGNTYVAWGGLVIALVLVWAGRLASRPGDFPLNWPRSLLVVGILLQVRNVSFGYLVPFLVAAVLVSMRGVFFGGKGQ